MSRALPSARTDDSGNVTLAIDAMRRIMRELRLSARKTEMSAGLSASQGFVLAVLAARDGMSVSEVARATMTDRSSVAAVVDKLVELGYAARTPSPEDRRRAAITCTPSGRRALRRAAPPPTVILIDAVRALSDADQHRLALGLTALTRALGIDDQPAGMLFDEQPAVTSKHSRGRHG